MSKAETALKYFETYNCAQSVLSAYAPECGLEKEKALQIAIGFGAGVGRLQETCGAVNAAIMVLGLSSGYKAEDGKERNDEIYARARSFIADFTREKGSIKCRDLLGCYLLSEKGQAFYKEHNLKDDCREYVRLCCELLDKYQKQQ